MHSRAPSSRMSTEVTPVLSVAETCTPIVPETEPPVGDWNETEGACVSALFTLTVTESVPLFPSASLAVAVRVWLASVEAVVSQEQE